MCYLSRYHSKGMYHPRFKNSKRGHFSRQSFMSGWNYPPINVQEFDDKFELTVYVSGYEKDDFSINIVKDTIVICGDRKDSEADSFSWRRREFDASGFERKFGLPEGIDVDAITAKYVDGILEVSLPKLSGFETNRKAVEIE